MKQKNLLKYGKTFTELSVRFSGNKKLPYSYYLLDSFTFNDAMPMYFLYSTTDVAELFEPLPNAIIFKI